MAQTGMQRLPTTETNVLRMLSHGASMHDVLNELCHFIGASSPGVIPTVCLLDPDGVHLRLAAGPEVPKVWRDALDGLTLPQNGHNGNGGSSLRSVSIADLKTYPSFAPCWNLVFKQGVRSAWAVPILSKVNTTLGNLILFCPTAPQPNGRDMQVMEQVIEWAAIAIECHLHEEELRREFSRQLYRSQDDERRRIARELHDSTGQKLAVLAMNLSTVKAVVTAQRQECDRILDECTSLTKDISEELRTLSYLLHPPMLDECGLDLAIQWYVSGINQRQGLRVEVDVSADLPRLSEEAELAIFRIVQASLTNVHLHSEAKSARVRIEHSAGGLILTISDDGKGMPKGVLERTSQTTSIGIGIGGMRERVAQLDGRLEIETCGTGTTVRAIVPSRHFRSVKPPLVAYA